MLYAIYICIYIFKKLLATRFVSFERTFPFLGYMMMDVLRNYTNYLLGNKNR